jgi:hypothetical protein
MGDEFVEVPFDGEELAPVPASSVVVAPRPERAQSRREKGLVRMRLGLVKSLAGVDAELAVLRNRRGG